jgi:hypothetical protein
MLNGRWLIAAATTVLFRSAKIFQKEIFLNPGVPIARISARVYSATRRRLRPELRETPPPGVAPTVPTKFLLYCCPPVSRSTVPTPTPSWRAMRSTPRP